MKAQNIEVYNAKVPVTAGSGIVFGIVLGAGLGLAFGNVALGVGIGIAIGAGLEGARMAYLDEAGPKKAKGA